VRRALPRAAAADLLIVPALAYLGILHAVPLALLLVKSVWASDGFTLEAYRHFLGDPYGWQVIRNTLDIATRTTLLCLLLGYPVALLMTRLRGALLGLLLIALILPVSLSVIVKAFAWQIVLRRNGVVNQVLQQLGLIEEPLRLLFTETGLIVGAANIFLPFMILPIYAVAKQLDARLADAAATLGAGSVYRFRRVTLPLTLPGIVGGVTVVFSLAISMYVIPTLLIGDRFQTLSTLTGRAFLTIRNEVQGAVTATILLALAMLVVIGSGLFARVLRPAR
jgi:putative spermidine/putrescine transport system permease protein